LFRNLIIDGVEISLWHTLRTPRNFGLTATAECLKKDGERGRNRTFNLLIFDEQPQINGFNGFPSIFVSTIRQI